jgi:anti-sigma factor RsiW
MKAMQCDRAGELIGAYLDQELDAELRREVATHLEGCKACAAVADDFDGLSRKIAAIGRELAPPHLAAAVPALIAAAAINATAPRRFAAVRSVVPGWLRQAIALLLACGVTAAVTAWMMSHTADTAMMEREVVAAHVRSLLQDSATQIASSDVHTIKPWFAGRLEFAPAVKDLISGGFLLAGARLDYIGERRVAALVYRRRLHVVNVFLWPSADAADTAPRELVHRGFNLIAWSRSGITYCAISDLNKAELRELQVQL